MTFGNYKYILYIFIAAFFILIFYMAYLYFRGKILSSLLKNREIRKILIPETGLLRKIKAALIITAIITAAFTLLLPEWGENTKEVSSEGSDVLIALDVSRSMLAKDIEPSRLDRAKRAVKWIAQSLKGDRIGLVLFAGEAFLQCPLTNDIGAFMMFLDSADPDSIGLQGTDIGAALSTAYTVFKKKRLTSRMLILITDGEDHQGAAKQGAEVFRELGVSVYTLGIGRDKGELIPAEEDSSGEVYQRNREGGLIRTQKNPDLLKYLAGRTRGSYIDISENLSGLNFILEIISDQKKNIYGSRIIKEPKQRFQIFAFLTVLLLSVEIMAHNRKKG